MSAPEVSASISGALSFWHHLPGTPRQTIAVRTAMNDIYETTVYWDAHGDFWYVDQSYMSDFAPAGIEFHSRTAALLFVEVLWMEGLKRGY